MHFQARVTLRLRPGILSAEAEATTGALKTLGFEVEELRFSREITFSLEANSLDEAEKLVKAMCNQLLVNPVTELAEVHVAPLAPIYQMP